MNKLAGDREVGNTCFVDMYWEIKIDHTIATTR